MCCTLQTLSSLVCRIAETLEPRETALQVKNSFDFYKYHYHYHRLHHHSLSVLSLGRDRKNGTAETMDMGMIMQAILKNGVGNTTHTHTHTHTPHRTHRTHRTHSLTVHMRFEIGPRTEGILKAIHQGVILTTAFEIKHKVTKSILTKDVRTKDGWRVHVHLAPNGAVVTHTRREMSIGTRYGINLFFSSCLPLATPHRGARTGAGERVRVRVAPVDVLQCCTHRAGGAFSLSLFCLFHSLLLSFALFLTEPSFSHDTSQAVKLRLTDLQFGPQTTAENKQKLNQTFFNGQLHVY
jgi:hypothetical protein